VAYLSCVSPTFSYISTTTHKIHPLKADRKVRIAGSDRWYIYTINLGQKCVRHWGMDFPLRCSGVHHISLHWALLGCSLEYKATACLSLVPVWRISAVLIMPVQDVLSTYPEYGCSKLFLHVSTACAHCNLHSPAPLWEPQISLLYFLSSFLCLMAGYSGKRELYFILTLEEHV
jgi:hypothetical protein